MNLVITPGELSPALLRKLASEFCPIELSNNDFDRIQRGADAVQAIVKKGAPAYGINTGFGKLAKVQVPNDQLELLQANLVRSHAVGVGEYLPDETVRLILVLKIASLARGYSGIRPEVVKRLLDLYNNRIWPCIPAKGSVGASGDLAPLAHLSLPLMGEGLVRVNDDVIPAEIALREHGLTPIRLAAKEGLALLNGTQVSTGIALRGYFKAEEVFAAAIVAGALSVDAARGSDAPFDSRIHEVRGHESQIRVAECYRNFLAGSEIRASHLEGDDRVQDPYSLRCQPQVMGACLDHLDHCAKILFTEANAVSDNPLVFPETGDVLSGGNFHAEPVAIAADVLAIATAEIGSLSERRIALLIDSSLSGLPPFLVSDPGVNSGFMIAHVTAAALASENKSLAHPASVDSLPTSANQEDHVSMATFAARKLVDVAVNVRMIIAIELLAAAQGIEFHRPLKSSKVLEFAVAEIRKQVPAYNQDRFFAPDLNRIDHLIARGVFTGLVQHLLPSYQEKP